MYPELRVRVQVDDIKLHLRSMSFDLREKNGGLIRVVQEVRIIDHELSLTKCDNRGKNKFGAPRPHSRQRHQCFCDEQEMGIDSGIGPFCKLAAAGG